MAITLDELLGRNTTVEKTAENFPSYEEFSSARNNTTRTVERNSAYGADYGYMSAQPRYEQQTYERPRQAQPRYNEDIYGDAYVQPARQQNFYEYVARNNAQINDADLYDRLSRTSEGMRPAFGHKDEDRHESVSARSAASAQQKARGRLNTKGKLILGSFLAVVVTVMSLIIAFASKINSGTATVPASNAAASVATLSEVL